jgi:hypothetical protein
MKKGNSVTKKVRRRRRIGGKYPKTPENPIETIPGIQRPRTPPPRRRPRTPPSRELPPPITPERLLQETDALLGITRTPRRNGGRTYKNKYKTKTP